MAVSQSVLLDVGFWSAVFFGTALLMFCMVYTLILFADLMIDRINAIELCDHINQLRYPEYFGHVSISLMLLLRGYYVTVLLNVPIILYNGTLLFKKKHMLDNTQIFVTLPRETRVSEVKLFFFLITFFVYLFLFFRTLTDT